MATESLLIKLALIGIVLYAATKFLTTSRNKSLPLPPGPKPLPLLGNIRDLPAAGVREWEHWAKHKDLYGPISSVTVLGTTIIIVSDAQLALELMEKRGHIHSSRPHMVFAAEMCGWGHVMAMQPYSDRLRLFRKHLYQVVGTKAVLAQFLPLQNVEVHRFLLRTLQTPNDLVQNLRTEAGAIILKIGYGYTVEPYQVDPFVVAGDRALEQFSEAAIPGAWLVDNIPALRYLPEWMPGTGFKKTARDWYKTLMDLAEKPIQFVKQEMAAKRHEPSFVSKFYEKRGEDISAEEEYVIKWSAASLYAGGADTSVSTMTTFFLAMVLNPDVQKKAQAEIDRVVGNHRLPTFADRGNLPYVEAVVKECFRWHPIAPMGVAHVTTEEDTCRGHRIPKGAMLVPNIWLFLHNPDVYDNPSQFNPDRFLASPPPPDPQDYAFGFGRRICPGRLLADSSVWLTLARSLAVFAIKKGIENGKEIEPEAKFTPGILSHPHPFKADIKARGPKHEELIRAVETEHPWEESSAQKMKEIEVNNNKK